MPGFVFALVALFPNSNIGLELAAILMIFTGQAWNMTFSFYHSVRGTKRPERSRDRLPLHLVAPILLGGAAGVDGGPRLEQHDEHGWRLVLSDA